MRKLTYTIVISDKELVGQVVEAGAVNLVCSPKLFFANAMNV